MLIKDIITSNRLPALYKRICQFMPGERKISLYHIIKNNYVSLLRTQSRNSIRSDHLETISGEMFKGKFYILCGTEYAAFYGNLEMLQCLREYDIHCTVEGANYAARNGHIHIIQDLHKHGIHPTYIGANLAAEDGHLEMVRLLRSYNIYTSQNVIRSVTKNGHLEIAEELLRIDKHFWRPINTFF